MATLITESTIRQFVKDVSDQHHVMSGVVIAASAAQAAALGEACIQISLDHQIDKFDWQAINAYIKQMDYIKEGLIKWCDREAETLVAQLSLNDDVDELHGQRMLCKSSSEVGWLAVEAIVMLQDFRSLVFEKVEHDLEIAISLLLSMAQASLLLLENNLRVWSEETSLLAEYEPVRDRLGMLIKQLLSGDSLNDSVLPVHHE